MPKDVNKLTHASSRDQAVEEAGTEAEGDAEAEADTDAEADPEAVEVGPPAHAPPPICVVVLVPGTTHKDPSALFFLTTRFAFGFLSSGEGPRASTRISPFRAAMSTWA